MIQPLLVFILTYYLGLVGFANPWKSISIISSVSFIIAIALFIINFSIKKHAIVVIIIVVTFIWSRFIEHLPLYGKYVIYNPFSVYGIGEQFYGEKNESYPTCDYEKIESVTIKNIQPHNIFSKIYAILIEIISSVTYLFGTKWIDSISIFTNIISILTRTGIKSVLGYVPRNTTLKETYFNRYMQDRVYSDNWYSKIGSVIRRYALIGIDMDALDGIFESFEYNNVPISETVGEFCARRDKYVAKKDKTMIEKWRWSTLPYIYRWIMLSMIVYALWIIQWTINKI